MWGARLKYATVPAIVARQNDCAAKIRMLVTIQRCATIAICSTSTTAAIRVTILLPNSGSEKVCMGSEEEGRDQRQRRQCERHGQQLGHAEEPHLGVRGLHQHDRTRSEERRVG